MEMRFEPLDCRMDGSDATNLINFGVRKIKRKNGAKSSFLTIQRTCKKREENEKVLLDRGVLPGIVLPEGPK